jgi:hypothetical protein
MRRLPLQPRTDKWNTSASLHLDMEVSMVRVEMPRSSSWHAPPLLPYPSPSTMQGSSSSMHVERMVDHGAGRVAVVSVTAGGEALLGGGRPMAGLRIRTFDFPDE